MYYVTKPYNTDILNLIKTTWERLYVSLVEGIVYKKFNYPEFHHTDGVGRKGEYHWKASSFECAVIDSLAMNLNDLAMAGAMPYALIDHLMIPSDDNNAIISLIKSLT